jgi:hypothetical protein
MMGIGPLQTIVIVFNGRDLPEDVARELYVVRQADYIRLVDSVFIEKGTDGELEVFAVSDLNKAEARRFVAAILTREVNTEMKNNPPANAEVEVAGIPEEFFISIEEVETVLKQVPPGSSAMIALIEHRWAEQLQESIEASGGWLLAERFIPKSSIEHWGERLIEAISDVKS